MAKANFLLKLTSFVDAAWPNIRDGHALGAVDDRYPCANPDGPVDNSDCPEDDPLCNCPCQELKPSSYEWSWLSGVVDVEKEPTDEEIQESLEEIKECNYIEDELGSDSPLEKCSDVFDKFTKSNGSIKWRSYLTTRISY